MSNYTLVIGNKNYSSWSLRTWLVLKYCRIKFTEVRIPLNTETTHQEILQHSPSGKIPVLHHGGITIWESLAICEYLAESLPHKRLLPKEPFARAMSRSICAEIHAGFQNLRQNMPMNCRAELPGKGMTPEVQKDIDRIISIWRDCRENFAGSGDFLFSHFTIADAMFAPIVLRFKTYGVELDAISQAYANAILNLTAMQEWLDAAKLETEVIPQFEL
ncbi:MAG: glutathione S-transferase family protein [Nostocaceae cyanobacterium]|nr:glutathione S-transferase family protein [Nostocaceae cyanobacterium]